MNEIIPTVYISEKSEKVLVTYPGRILFSGFKESFYTWVDEEYPQIKRELILEKFSILPIVD